MSNQTHNKTIEISITIESGQVPEALLIFSQGGQQRYVEPVTCVDLPDTLALMLERALGPAPGQVRNIVTPPIMIMDDEVEESVPEWLMQL